MFFLRDGAHRAACNKKTIMNSTSFAIAASILADSCAARPVRVTLLCVWCLEEQDPQNRAISCLNADHHECQSCSVPARWKDGVCLVALPV